MITTEMGNHMLGGALHLDGVLCERAGTRWAGSLSRMSRKPSAAVDATECWGRESGLAAKRSRWPGLRKCLGHGQPDPDLHQLVLDVHQRIGDIFDRLQMPLFGRFP